MWWWLLLVDARASELDNAILELVKYSQAEEIAAAIDAHPALNHRDFHVDGVGAQHAVDAVVKAPKSNERDNALDAAEQILLGMGTDEADALLVRLLSVKVKVNNPVVVQDASVLFDAMRANDRAAVQEVAGGSVFLRRLRKRLRGPEVSVKRVPGGGVVGTFWFEVPKRTVDELARVLDVQRWSTCWGQAFDPAFLTTGSDSQPPDRPKPRRLIPTPLVGSAYGRALAYERVRLPLPWAGLSEVVDTEVFLTVETRRSSGAYALDFKVAPDPSLPSYASFAGWVLNPPTHLLDEGRLGACAIGEVCDFPGAPRVCDMEGGACAFATKTVKFNWYDAGLALQNDLWMIATMRIAFPSMIGGGLRKCQ